MNELIIIVGMALVTFAVRYPVLALVGKIQMPEPVFRALKYVPPAVLTAIIIPGTLFKNDQITVSYTNDFLVAGIISAIVAWRSKNLLLTIVIGMATLLAWRWLLGTHILG
ncbi:MAG TPA: AzlD domain-containing protein [Aggregatilineales bacterium]|nr:AzlD domain-containing protein [Aggregatilineales bacterium]